MKIWRLLSIWIFVASVLISTEGFTTLIQRYNFPELVARSSIIAKGTIVKRNNKPVLVVEHVLKGEAGSKVIIQSQSLAETPAPKFEDDEVVLLFLQPRAAEGTARLIGYGDQAKWPRSKGTGGYPEILIDASLEDIQKTVEKLLLIEDALGLEEKTKLCAEYIGSSNSLLQLTVLQHVLGGLLWPPPPGDPFPIISHEAAKKRFDILRNLSSGAVALLGSDKPSIRAAAIRLLRYAPPGVAMPNLIMTITDEDASVRTATHTVLRTLSIELKVAGEFEYDPDDPAERLVSVQDEWNNWWRQNKDSLQ